MTQNVFNESKTWHKNVFNEAKIWIQMYLLMHKHDSKIIQWNKSIKWSKNVFNEAEKYSIKQKDNSKIFNEVKICSMKQNLK